MARLIDPLRCWLIASVWLLHGCVVAEADLDPLPTAGNCTCTETNGESQCPKTHCGIRVVVDEVSCDGKVEKVEVLIADTVEDRIWRVGDSQLSCRAIPVGGQAVIFARADTPWKWQSDPLTCTSVMGGGEINHVLECKTN